jgi:hypothetical protein
LIVTARHWLIGIDRLDGHEELHLTSFAIIVFVNGHDGLPSLLLIDPHRITYHLKQVIKKVGQFTRVERSRFVPIVASENLIDV